MPFEEHMSQRTAETNQETIQAIVQGMIAQAAGKTVWINAVNANVDITDQEETKSATRPTIPLVDSFNTMKRW